ncbi:hypothetical protein ABZ876_21300 [Streptomyces sp. NPDC046931]|uniref:hypothetical protein n=1 Tax=Streptomyces sp. NPDC046931 TaxID=3154806 RepID=UPI0033CCDC75
MPALRPDRRNRPAPDTATVVIRWACFTCVLVPVVLVWSGTSVAGAISATLGLTAITWACRALLRQCERGAARPADVDRAPGLARPGTAGAGARRGGRSGGANTPVD